MQNPPQFVRDFLSAGETLWQTECVKEPLFSRGTYQIEVQEKGKKGEFPFIQIKEDGSVLDAFCTCKQSETGKGCPHLAAAFLRIFNAYEEPLHVRFRQSIWNRLCQMAAKRHGVETSCLKSDKEGRFFCKSETKKVLFSIEAQSVGAKKRLQTIIQERVLETEETSIKFSNLSAEEIAQFRQGKASHLLRYELSFWADIAKWLMFLQEEKKPFTFTFKGKPVPNEISIQFPGLRLWFYVSEVNLPWLIPALHTVPSSLRVFDEEEEIEAMEYDETTRTLLVRRSGVKRPPPNEVVGYPVGDWLYVEGQGFYRKRSPSFWQEGTIPEEQIGPFLTQAIGQSKALQKFLPIHPDAVKAQYQLYFDPEANLQIEFYLFEKGDVSTEGAACFVPWVYLPKKGFYLVEDWLFEGNHKTVPKTEVADFVNNHRSWLHQFPAFQTHLGSLESYLVYTLSPEGNLSFDAHLNFPEEEALNFEQWVYIKGQGFYTKKEGQGRLPLHPGLVVLKEEVASFVSQHKEELEQVRGFFHFECPVQKMGLVIGLNEEGLIAITPQIEYAPGIDPSKVQMFGPFLYLEGRGFSEIPPAMQLPERYRHPLIIEAHQESGFLSYELEPLKPFILTLDPRLEKASHLQLKIRKIVRDRKKEKEWFVDLAYESTVGVIDLFSIWDAFSDKKKHLFSTAGLIALKEPRFHWIRQLPKKRLDRKRGMVRLNTLEWIRLSAFEALQEPQGDAPEAVETRRLLEELSRYESNRLLDITRLKSTLRPYQEEGLRWLWFLYCHGLSGLLCDDMGLGKTHQAMALLAAVLGEDPEKKNKYLVVCPTSVIYHWQELLQKFLPELRTCTYYGLTRSLEDFEENFDLLLTSYGILRTGRDNFRGPTFEVAIFDEIQVAKNFASQTHQALRAVSAQMRLGLTGTPIENRLRELKSLFDIVLPSYLPPDATFRDLFIHPIEKGNEEEAKFLLAKLVKPFILRRKKSEVLRDLPEKIEELSHCDLSEQQQKLYREVALQMRDTVYRELKDATKPIPYVHVFSALSTMKRICDHPALILGDIKKYSTQASGKWDLFVELLHEALGSGQKIVVFSQYLEMLAIIEAYLKKKGIGFASIKGSTRDRSAQLRKFREDPACEVFVASLLAAGVGIDLTVASIVIHYDRWWNPAKENQATDRVHRIGQNRGVQVFKLITKNTIEEHIHEMIEKKKGLLEQIIGTEDQISYLSREELVQVFERMYT